MIADRNKLGTYSSTASPARRCLVVAARPRTVDDVPRPKSGVRIERRPLRDQIEAFEAEGWYVTDAKRRPLRTPDHFPS